MTAVSRIEELKKWIWVIDPKIERERTARLKELWDLQRSVVTDRSAARRDLRDSGAS